MFISLGERGAEASCSQPPQIISVSVVMRPICRWRCQILTANLSNDLAILYSECIHRITYNFKNASCTCITIACRVAAGSFLSRRSFLELNGPWERNVGLSCCDINPSPALSLSFASPSLSIASSQASTPISTSRPLISSDINSLTAG